MLTYSFIYLKYKKVVFIFLSKQSWTNDPLTQNKSWFLLDFSWSHEYSLINTKSCEFCNMNILLIHHDHMHLTLSLADLAESNSSTSIPKITTHASEPGWKIRPRGGAGGVGAPMVRPHHPLLRWPPIFACISLVSCLSQPWRCLVCFLHGRGPSTYKSHPIASPHLTPSYKLSSLPPLKHSKLLAQQWPAMLSLCTRACAPLRTLMSS